MKHREELRQLIRNALAIVLPSLLNRNQLLNILEAFTFGKPVARAMRWMVANPGKVNAMGKTAQRYVLNQHGPELHYERLMDVYSRVSGRAEASA